MTTKPNPRDLDPNYKPEKVHVEEIVYWEQYMENSVQMKREHRVPLADWDTYAQEHGF